MNKKLTLIEKETKYIKIAATYIITLNVFQIINRTRMKTRIQTR
jgi:hypothetical protein